MAKKKPKMVNAEDVITRSEVYKILDSAKHKLERNRMDVFEELKQKILERLPNRIEITIRPTLNAQYNDHLGRVSYAVAYKGDYKCCAYDVFKHRSIDERRTVFVSYLINSDGEVIKFLKGTPDFVFADTIEELHEEMRRRIYERYAEKGDKP